jgi:hypothetical protein
MRYIIFILSAFIIVSCNSKKGKDEKKELVVQKISRGDSALLTDTSWGWVRSYDNIDSLKKIFGDSSVRDERICGAECMDSVDVTFIHPGSLNEFVVYWNDSAYHKQIAFIRSYTANSPYHNIDGIRLGTTLKEVLRINGRPVTFSGFGWDYGGGINSLGGGKLENSKLSFNLDLPDNPGGDESVYGDTELTTEMPKIKKLLDKIVVSEFFLSFSK